MQLEAYIRSLKFFSSSPVDLTVLFKPGNDRFREAYSKLQKDFPDVEFIEESNFRRQIYRWLKESSASFVMFGCDDVVFKENFDTEIMAEAFKNLELFAFSLRMGTEINYSATSCTAAITPSFISREPFLLWNWRKAVSCWNYPFELDCSVYRKAFVEKLLELMSSITPDWGHPNRFESLGKNIADQISEFSFMASYPSSKANVITINRVQDICLNDVYDSSDIFSPEKLLELWNRGVVIDIEAYRGKKYRAVHIGETFLCRRDDGGRISGLPEYDIFKVMISDYARKVVKEKDTFLINHSGFPDYIKEFDAYFHMPSAETEQTVIFNPCLNDKKGKPTAVASPASLWIKERAELLKLSKTVNMEFPAELPFADGSIELLTAVDVIEYMGLGRYGEALDPEGSAKVFREASRVLSLSGHFLAALPVAENPVVCFNEKRIFTRENVLSFFSDFKIVSEKIFPVKTGDADNLNCFAGLEYFIWCFDLEKK